MLKVPAIDIAEVGSGGGSLAGIDKGGLAEGRARSRPAPMPGPACYGLGNAAADRHGCQRGARAYQSTAHWSAVGSRSIGALSERAIMRTSRGRSGCRWRMRRTASARWPTPPWRAAIRAVTVERGRDPRDLTLIAIGGNGGIHAVDVARYLGIRRVVVPPLAGVFQRRRDAGLGPRAHRSRHRDAAARCADRRRSGRMKARLADDVTPRLSATAITGARVATALGGGPAPRGPGDRTDCALRRRNDRAELAHPLRRRVRQDLRLSRRKPD